MAEQIKPYVGGIKLPGIIQKTGQSPLDDRLIVKKYNDLLNPNTWTVDESENGDKTWYVGMSVIVLETKRLYILIDTDPTNKAYWKCSEEDLSNQIEEIGQVLSWKEISN